MGGGVWPGVLVEGAGKITSLGGQITYAEIIITLGDWLAWFTNQRIEIRLQDKSLMRREIV